MGFSNHLVKLFPDLEPWVQVYIYGVINKLLIPFGLHHAVNNVFWFDTIGINDIGNFWGSTGVQGITTGMYR